MTVDDPALWPLVHAVLPPGWREAAHARPDVRFALTTDEDGSVVVTHDGARASSRQTAEIAIHTLDAKLRLHVARFAPGWTFVHAGAVATGGRAIVLPARSFAGKTTLVQALLALGAEYLSDEYAVIDPRGLVHPYPKPLSVRRGDGFRLGREVPAASLGATTANRAHPIALVAATRFVEGGSWAPEERSPAEGALLLIENAVAALDDPDRIVRDLRTAVQSAKVLEGERGEAEQAAARILDAAARE